MGTWAMPPTDPWEEEQKRREQMMTEALARSESATIPNPGSIVEPENNYLDDYAAHVRSMPRREDYEPSTLRKVLSVIGGTLAGGDPRVTNSLAYGKYNRALGDWEREGQGLKDVAAYGTQQRGQDVTMRGQDVAARTAREGREFQAGEAGKERGFRTAEREAGQEFAAGQAAEDRRFRTGEREATQDFQAGESAADRAIRSRDVAARERYYDTVLGNQTRQAELTPQQREAAWNLAVERVAANNPQWSDFAAAKGVMPFEEGGWFGYGGMDASEYAAFIKAVEKEFAATTGMRTTKAPGGGQ